MRGLAYLALRHAVHNLGTTAVLTVCVAVAVFLPGATWVVMREYSAGLRERARETPLVGGAKGNRFDLTLGALYFRRSGSGSIGGGGSSGEPRGVGGLTMREFEGVRDVTLGVFVPLHVGFTARGRAVVGTSVEYFEQRRMGFREGGCFVMLGECVVGATVASELGLTVGSALFSDQEEVYDISKPAALKMRVCGVLEPTGEADDRAVFVDLKTCWVMEGHVHGHTDPTTLREDLVLGRVGRVAEGGEGAAGSGAGVVKGAEEEVEKESGTGGAGGGKNGRGKREGGHVAVSEALIEYNEITEENADSWHVHGDAGRLGITGYIVWPRDEKSKTIIKARVNASATQQMSSSAEVVEELLGMVVRIKGILDGAWGALGACAAALMVLVGMLSVRLRAREFQTLNRIGASRGVAVRLAALEWAWIVGAGCAVAAAGVWWTAAASGWIVRMIM